MPEHDRADDGAAAKLPATTQSWAFEIKWDGVRAIFYCEGGRVRLESRNLRDVTAQYPELRALGRDARLTRGRARRRDRRARRARASRASSRLQRAHARRLRDGAVRRCHEDTPVVYMIFDLLYLDGHSTMALPYTERRELLERARARRAALADARAITSATARRCSRRAASRASRAWSPSGSTAATSRASASGAWLKIKNHLEPGVRGRRLAARAGRARATAIGSLARRLLRRGRASCKLRRQRRHRLHGADAGASCSALLEPLRTDDEPVRGPPAAEGDRFRASQSWWRRSSSANGPVQGRSGTLHSRACGTTKTRRDVVLPKRKFPPEARMEYLAVDGQLMNRHRSQGVWKQCQDRSGEARSASGW